MTKDRLAGAFKLFDKDDSGFVTPQEIREVLSAQENRVPQDIIDVIIKQVDQNGDGEISLDEFVEMMHKAF